LLLTALVVISLCLNTDTTSYASLGDGFETPRKPHDLVPSASSITYTNDSSMLPYRRVLGKRRIPHFSGGVDFSVAHIIT
jgi:hypothetical protein